MYLQPRHPPGAHARPCTEMRGELSPDETELLALTDSTLAKLRAMTDAEFDELELYPDFDE